MTTEKITVETTKELGTGRSETTMRLNGKVFATITHSCPGAKWFLHTLASGTSQHSTKALALAAGRADAPWGPPQNTKMR